MSLLISHNQTKKIRWEDAFRAIRINRVVEHRFY